ncbi:hypothetical protein [Mycolicibacterium komossense]|uniref:PE-PGRS family protein n=1 Tax=Mycolicibacterium komossense TaxID=1779 RepID=A0ABT3CKL8_9MYCO|nr:hypothetical protein [Mycolicibacterium komossense]MCV7229917.1 hypothetical protein [Mycolicibacterium komossense]
MHAALRPHLTTGIAIVGASVLLVSPLTVPGHEIRAAESSAAVELTAATTAGLPDLGLTLQGIATLALAVATSQANIALFTAGVPSMAVEVLVAAALNPAATPALVSYVAHRLLELPTATNADVDSLLADAATPVVNALAQVLPAPWGLSDSDIGLVNTYFATAATMVNTFLDNQFGAPVAPGTVIQGVIDGIFGGIFGATTAAAAPSLPSISLTPADLATIAAAVLTSQMNVIAFGAGVPALALKVVLAAALSPTSIPGLQSYVAHTLLELPTATDLDVHSLLSDATTPIVDALAAVLPGPFGQSTTDPTDIGIVRTAAFAIGSMVNQYLETFGAPVDPDTVGNGIFGGIFGTKTPATTAVAATTSATPKAAPSASDPSSDPAQVPASVKATRTAGPRQQTLKQAQPETFAVSVTDSAIGKAGSKDSANAAAAAGAAGPSGSAATKPAKAKGTHGS